MILGLEMSLLGTMFQYPQRERETEREGNENPTIVPPITHKTKQRKFSIQPLSHQVTIDTYIYMVKTRIQTF